MPGAWLSLNFLPELIEPEQVFLLFARRTVDSRSEYEPGGNRADQRLGAGPRQLSGVSLHSSQRTEETKETCRESLHAVTPREKQVLGANEGSSRGLGRGQGKTQKPEKPPKQPSFHRFISLVQLPPQQQGCSLTPTEDAENSRSKRKKE